MNARIISKLFFIFLLHFIWQEPPFAQENLDKWDKLASYAFDTKDHRSTHAVVISQKGKIIFEKYAFGWNESKKHHSWSMAKSISALIILAAVDDGYVKLDTHLKDLNLDQLSKSCIESNSQKKLLRILDLLTMSSGINFSERYETGPFYSSVINMLYGSGQNNMGQYALCMPQIATPGSLFEYSSGDTNILMMALRAALPKEVKDSYPWLKLFDPLEIDATWETDETGTLAGSSWVYMRPKDYLKIGEFILNNGSYKDKQIISKEKIKLLFTSAEVNKSEKTLKNFARGYYESPMLLYGHGTWLNRPIDALKIPKPYPEITDNLAFILGHRGQSITVIPELETVLVRLGDDTSESFSRELFLKMVMDAIKGEKHEN